jgi:hypothetical protein
LGTAFRIAPAHALEDAAHRRRLRRDVLVD